MKINDRRMVEKLVAAVKKLVEPVEKLVDECSQKKSLAAVN